MNQLRTRRVARSRATDYAKSQDETILQNYVDTLRENGDNVIGPAPGRAGGVDSEGQPFPPVGDVGWWYICIRNGTSRALAPGIVATTRAEGMMVVGKWAGD